MKNIRAKLNHFVSPPRHADQVSYPGNLLLGASYILDFICSSWFLSAKLVAWESEDFKALVLILLIKLFEALVLLFVER